MTRSGEKFDKCHTVESRFFLKIMSRMLKKNKNVPKFRENEKNLHFCCLILLSYTNYSNGIYVSLERASSCFEYRTPLRNARFPSKTVCGIVDEK